MLTDVKHHDLMAKQNAKEHTSTDAVNKDHVRAYKMHSVGMNQLMSALKSILST